MKNESKKLLQHLLSRLDNRSQQEIFESIIKQYESGQSRVVSFLYFASIAEIFDIRHTENPSPPAILPYLHTLQKSDYLFPDGIALALLYERLIRAQALSYLDVFALASGLSKLSLPNHNGTDFVPTFIDHLCTSGKQVHLTLLSAYDPHIGKPQNALEDEMTSLKERFPGLAGITGKNTLFSERSLNDFQEIWKTIPANRADNEYQIILLSTGSPHQELWCDMMRSEIDSHHVLCFCTGGLIDFISGRERRAPRWIRSMRLEWLYRSIVAPKKNLKKAKKSQSLFSLIFDQKSPFISHL